jgi:hypothetical protein
MQPTPPPYGFTQIVQEIIRGVVDTVVERPHLTPERKVEVRSAVICSMMAYNPRDPVEATIAGQCVIFDQVVHDAARDLFRGQNPQIKLKTRPGVLAAGKVFLATVQALSSMQARAAEQLVFARPPEQPAEPAAQAEPAEAPASEADTEVEAAVPLEMPPPTRDEEAPLEARPKAAQPNPPASAPTGHRPQVMFTREELQDMVIAQVVPDGLRNGHAGGLSGGGVPLRPGNGTAS